MAEEQAGAGTAAPAAAAPAASTGGSQQASHSAAPARPVVAAMKAKATSQAAGQAAGGAQAQPDGQQATGEPPKGPEGTQDGGAATTIDPVQAEYDKWLESKGVKLGDAGKHPDVVKVLDMYRNLEGTHTKTSQQLKELQDREKTWLAQQQATQGSEDKSPVDKLEELYGNAISAQCSLHGCANEADFAAKFPQAYNQLRAEYQNQYLKAAREEMRWENSKAQKEQEKAARDAKLAEGLRSAKLAMHENVVEAKKLDPAVETNLMASGAIGFITELGKLLKVPNEMILAEPKWFKFFAEASNAIMAGRNMDKTKAKWKQEYEADVAKAARASSPSPMDATPPDNKVVLARTLKKGKTANAF